MVDQAGHEVPPLRFASVGMTELFGCARGRGGGIVSHPGAKNARGWGTLSLVWERKSIGDAASVGIRFLARSSSPSRRQVPRGLKPGVHWDRRAARLKPGPFKTVCWLVASRPGDIVGEGRDPSLGVPGFVGDSAASG
jgi:hypothetical protein